MGRKLTYTPDEKAQVVLKILTKQKPIATMAKELEVSEQTLYRWRDEFLQAGTSAMMRKPPARVDEVDMLKREIAKRDRLIGELVVSTRVAA